MGNDTPWYVSLIISVVPFVLYFGVIVWHGLQIRRSMTTKDGRSLAQVVDTLTQEIRRGNDLRDSGRP